MIKKPDYNEQGIFDPVTGKNITGDVISESRDLLELKIEDLLEVAYLHMRNKDSPDNILKIFSEKFREVTEQYFNSIKQPVDEDFLKESISFLNKIVNAYRELLTISKIAEKFNLSSKITENPILSFHFDWQCNIHSLFITFKKDNKLNSTLLAVPLCNMTTNTYGPYYVGGTPPAAELIRITENAMIFFCQENTPPYEFLEELKTPTEQVQELIPCVMAEKRGLLLEITLDASENEKKDSKTAIINQVFKQMPEIKIMSVVTKGSPIKEFITKQNA